MIIELMKYDKVGNMTNQESKENKGVGGGVWESIKSMNMSMIKYEYEQASKPRS